MSEGFRVWGRSQGVFCLFSIFFLFCFSSYSQNKTSFVPLVPGAGTTWNNIRETVFTVSENSNRLLTIANAGEERRLVQMDKITGGYLGSTPSSQGLMEWGPVEIEAWPEGDRAVVGWGESRGGTERFYPTGMEFFSIKTGESLHFREDLSFVRFDVDEETGVLRGLGHAEGDANFSLMRLNLSTDIAASLPVGPATNEAILKSVIWDATGAVLYALYQPTKSPSQPNQTQKGGFIEGYQIPFGNVYGPVTIPAGNYRNGGMALDPERRKIYVVPFETGGSVYQVDTATMVLEATYSEDMIDPDYDTAGAVAVHRSSGDIFLSNGAESKLDKRILRVRVSGTAPEVIQAWSSGADVSYMVYDSKVNLLYGASEPSQSLTIISLIPSETVTTLSTNGKYFFCLCLWHFVANQEYTPNKLLYGTKLSL